MSTRQQRNAGSNDDDDDDDDNETVATDEIETVRARAYMRRVRAGALWGGL